MNDLLDQLKEARSLATTPKDRAEVDSLIQAAEWDKIRRDPWYFLSTMALTKNEHITDVDEDPYQPFPNYAYVREIVNLLMAEDRLVIPKSRQVMVSWIMAGFCLWWALTKRGQLILIQSKKEEDAGRVIERLFGIYSRLPEYIRAKNPISRQKKPPQLIFGNTDCTILGIPEGEDQVRSNTASLWFADEAAFQPQFAGAFAAAQPALEGGGRAVIASSAKAGKMYEIVSDPVVGGTHKVVIPSWSPMNGLEKWKTSTGWTIARLHYSADPRKDFKWAKEAASKYGRLGMQSKEWQAEMEIDPGANLGELVYGEFSRNVHVIRGFTDRNKNFTNKPPHDWPVFLGIDPGFNDPCAVVFLTQDGDGCWYVWDEIYKRQHTVKDIAREIKRKLGRIDPEQIWIGHDAASKTQAGGGVSIQEQFSDHNIYAEIAYSKINEKIPRITELLKPMANGEPRLKVLENCKWVNYEFKNYRYPDKTLEQLLKRDAGEKPQEKDNHAMDALSNVLCTTTDDYSKRWAGVQSEQTKWESLPKAARDKVFRRKPGGGDPGQSHYWD